MMEKQIIDTLKMALNFIEREGERENKLRKIRYATYIRYNLKNNKDLKNIRTRRMWIRKCLCGINGMKYTR